MNELTIYGELLTASEEERTITGLLMPFGEVGHTSAGTVTASANTLTIPDAAEIKLNLEHAATAPVGRCTSIEEREDGLHASFRIAKTNAGNDLLEEVKEGLRSSLSIEIQNPVIKAGELLGGLISGAAAVVNPAFKSASIYGLTASDTTPIKDSPMDTTSTLEAAEIAEPTFVQAAPLFAADSTPTSFGAVALAAAPEGAEALNAALATFKTTNDSGKAYLKDQEVELWEAHKSERPLVNAVTNKPLTGLVLTGTRKTRTVKVADWAGNLVELPTGTFTTSREYFNAKGKAVAVELAMEVLEFGSEDIINEIYSQAVDSYIEQTETELITKIGAQSTAVSAAMGVVKAIDYASQALVAMGASMSTIVVSADVYSALIALKAADAPFWFAGQASIDLASSSANAGGVTFKVANGLAPKTVLVFDKRAIQFYESAEFKQRAVNVANGGVTVNLIKFNASYVSDPQAVLRFTNVTGV